MRTLPGLLLLPLMACSVSAYASRIVFYPLSLAELVRASETIVVVERTARFGVIEQTEKNGCVSQRWPLRIRHILKAGADGAVDGKIVPVIVNATALRGCGFIKHNVMVSMVVDTYGTQEREQLQNSPRSFIAFLRPTEYGYALAAVNGIESESRLAEIAELTKRADQH